jgi:phosphopantothenoylcysteine synthetase/decarboxylase
VKSADSGFGAETTRAWILSPGNEPEALPLVSKAELARRLFDRVAALIPAASARS